METTPKTNKNQSILIPTLIIYTVRFAICYLLNILFTKITLTVALQTFVSNLYSAIALVASGAIYCKLIVKKKCDYLTIVLPTLFFTVINFMVRQFVFVEIFDGAIPYIANIVLDIWPAVCIAMAVTLPKSE